MNLNIKTDNCPIHGQTIFKLYPHKNNPNNYNCVLCLHEKLNLRSLKNKPIEIIRVCKKHGATIFKWYSTKKSKSIGQYWCLECKREYNRYWLKNHRNKCKNA